MKRIPCIYCGSNDHREILKGKDRLLKIDDKNFSIVECIECSLVFLNPQPERSDLDKYYPENYGPYIEEEIIKYGPISKLLIKIKQARVSEAKKNIEKDNSRNKYLDFGCGGGFNLVRKKKTHHNWEFYGLDNSEKACQAAREKGFTVYYDKDSSFQLPEKYFDIINLSQVLEHLNNPVTTLKRLYHALKDDGLVTVSIPNYDSWSRQIFKSRWYALDVPRHLFHYTPKTVEKVLKKAGFKIIKINYINSPKVFIKSFYYIIGLGDKAINPFLWKSITPFSRLAAKRGKSSQISIGAQKLKE